MAKLKDILGINARSSEYLILNKKGARKRCDDKLLTKKFLRKYKIAHPKLLKKFSSLEESRSFDWMKLNNPRGFVIKPVQGLAGNGILIIKKPSKFAGEWRGIRGEKYSASDLMFHTNDIIEGRFSRNNIPDQAIVEERVTIHPKFAKLASGGTPDVRVAVFNGVPVMAMLRLPTDESGGRANLHQGAIGLGIDLATGITTFGVYKDKLVKYFPGIPNKKVNGISIPFWKSCLLIASEAAMANKLFYGAVDMLLDKEKGPLVIELNDQPGLSIQLANRAGLKRRLERVEGLEVESAEKGAMISKSLFASKFANRVKNVPGEKRIVGIFEKVKIRIGKKQKKEINAKIDTGAKSTSIDRKLAEELGLLKQENILWEKKFKSALGVQKRELIKIIFWLKGKRIETRAGVTDRHNLRRKIIIGRRDLRDFLVDSNLVRLRKK
jgi:alpha-L-glutamate ligase-like protein